MSRLSTPMDESSVQNMGHLGEKANMNEAFTVEQVHKFIKEYYGIKITHREMRTYVSTHCKKKSGTNMFYFLDDYKHIVPTAGMTR